MVLNQVQNHHHAVTAEDKGELGQARAFSLFNKLVLNVVERGNKLLTHVMDVVD